MADLHISSEAEADLDNIWLYEEAATLFLDPLALTCILGGQPILGFRVAPTSSLNGKMAMNAVTAVCYVHDACHVRI